MEGKKKKKKKNNNNKKKRHFISSSALAEAEAGGGGGSWDAATKQKQARRSGGVRRRPIALNMEKSGAAGRHTQQSIVFPMRSVSVAPLQWRKRTSYIGSCSLTGSGSSDV